MRFTAHIERIVPAMKQHMSLLGFKVRDAVTGFTGVVTSISFELYGCVQALVNPGLEKEGKCGEQYWFDLKRLQPIGKKPVMQVPEFNAVPGGEKLPQFQSKPSK
jgi:hypothetical protein